MIEIKKCKRHGLTQFSSSTSPRTRCNKCQVEAVKKRRHKIKKMAVDYLGGKCSICGYDKCIEALHFHHRDPSEKEFSIARSQHVVSWDAVKKEIDKCDLLCANCHAEEHVKLRL